METKKIRFTVRGEDYTMDVHNGRAEVIVHTPGGDITAKWEQGEGLYNVEGLSSLDDDWNGHIDDILRQAGEVLDALIGSG